MAKRTRSLDEVTLTVGIDPQMRKDLHKYVIGYGTTIKDLIVPLIKKKLELAGTYSPGRPYKPLVERLLEEGRHTGKEIAEIVRKEFPKTKVDTVLQFLSDAKRDHLFTKRVASINRPGCLCFGKPWGDDSGVQEGQNESPGAEEPAD
ncbi:MAG: hypothetical protein ACLQVJ_03340 [Syntrophobacteraceae bacterium]